MLHFFQMSQEEVRRRRMEREREKGLKHNNKQLDLNHFTPNRNKSFAPSLSLTLDYFKVSRTVKGLFNVLLGMGGVGWNKSEI